ARARGRDPVSARSAPRVVRALDPLAPGLRAHPRGVHGGAGLARPQSRAAARGGQRPRPPGGGNNRSSPRGPVPGRDRGRACRDRARGLGGGGCVKRYKDIAGDGGSNIAGQVEAQQGRLKRRLESVRAIVAIVSGKGGVGKSTLTANLACAFALDGWK